MSSRDHNGWAGHEHHARDQQQNQERLEESYTADYSPSITGFNLSQGSGRLGRAPLALFYMIRWGYSPWAR